MEQWVCMLKVVQDVYGLDRELKRVKKARSKSDIRFKQSNDLGPAMFGA